MTRYFVACELGEARGRVVLGAFRKDCLTLSQIHCFQNGPVSQRDVLLWDAARLFAEILVGLREVGGYDELIDGISCTSWAGDYVLFDADGGLISPTYHHGDARMASGRNQLHSRISAERIYAETGVHPSARSALFHLAAEPPKRLKNAAHLMPIADGFNYLLSGFASMESSSASATQLFNPIIGTWSEPLIDAARVPARLLPPVVASGTQLGLLRAEIAEATALESPRIIASCSHEIAATVAGLPGFGGDSCAFLRLEDEATIGAGQRETIHDDEAMRAGFSNVVAHGPWAVFHKQTAGLRIIEECRRFWAESDQGIDAGLLTHLAASSPPMESFINLNDPRFSTPGDMPLKIRAYCKETGQTEPRKPGPIIRCVLESLALHYRKVLDEITAMTGSEFFRLYLLGDTSNHLLKHFIANALQIPVVTVPPDSAALGNLTVQALATGHFQSLADARQFLSECIKTETTLPHAAAWAPAYNRFVELTAS